MQTMAQHLFLGLDGTPIQVLWQSAAESLCLYSQGLLLKERRRLGTIPKFILSLYTTQISHTTHYGGRVHEETEKGQGCYVNEGFSPGSEGRDYESMHLPSVIESPISSLYSLYILFLNDSSDRMSTFSYHLCFSVFIRYFLSSTFCTDLWEVVTVFLK